MKEELISSLLEINGDLLDTCINELSRNGLLSNIPVFGSMIALAKTRKTISDIILLEKLKRFANNLDQITDKERLEFLFELEQDPIKKNRVGESVLLVLDHFSAFEKAEVLAIMFSSYIKKEIDFADFQRLALAIDLAYLEDLKTLLLVPSRHTKEMQEGLLRSGLTSFSQHSHAIENGFGEQTTYTPIIITRLGEKFREIILNSKKFEANE